MSGPRKYAIQRPKGAKWETLALVDDLATGQREFRHAVTEHAANPVRLIQVDFISADALSDFDWRLVELHDPRTGGDGARPKPTVIAGSERADTPRKQPARPAAPKPGAPPRPGSGAGRGRGEPEKVPVPMTTYVAAFLFGALALVLWAVWFRV